MMDIWLVQEVQLALHWLPPWQELQRLIHLVLIICVRNVIIMILIQRRLSSSQAVQDAICLIRYVLTVDISLIKWDLIFHLRHSLVSRETKSRILTLISLMNTRVKLIPIQRLSSEKDRHLRLEQLVLLLKKQPMDMC